MKKLNLFKKIESFGLVILSLLLLVAYFRPIPAVSAAKTMPAREVTTTPIELPWPAYGQAAFGALGYGTLDKNQNRQTPVPMASIAKIITALMVLEKKPLDSGQQGPVITFTQEDVRLYEKYLSMGGSVVPVSVGGQLSQYQALQALLLPSANNIAERLASWSYGSMEEYLAQANGFLKRTGFSNTVVADATGFSENTVSTPEELIKIGELALANPVIKDIVSQSQATIPIAGNIRNVNWLLNSDGVIGIKTGNTEPAGGCYLFAAERTILGRKITVIGAIMSAPDLDTAITDSKKLIVAGDEGFQLTASIRKGETIGTYSPAWGGSVKAVAKTDVSIVSWKGAKVTQRSNLDSLTPPLRSGQVVGFTELSSANQKSIVPAVIQEDIPTPPWQWRLLR